MNTRLDSHIQEFRDHIDAEQIRWDALLAAQQENNRQISLLVESTSGLVDAWGAATGAAKVLSVVGKVATWLASLAVFLAIADWWSGHR